MFQCKVCAEKDKRIEDLSKQVDLLSRLCFPTGKEPARAFQDSLEANKILDGSSEQITIDQDAEDSVGDASEQVDYI